ncbi:hypothetical protein QR685DRAFT_451918 [Neurospora intermedia]|uniref:Uncharacterized protein n=1 Tax=Neurospora intermedia TaxID=5142 RepID=A0ABR3D061_NEUIN
MSDLKRTDDGAEEWEGRRAAQQHSQHKVGYFQVVMTCRSLLRNTLVGEEDEDESFCG